MTLHMTPTTLIRILLMLVARMFWRIRVTKFKRHCLDAPEISL
jgi:hypothetical protein